MSAACAPLSFPKAGHAVPLITPVRIFLCPSLFPTVRNETYGRHRRRKCIRHDGGFLYAPYNYLTSKQVLSNLEVRRQIYFLPSVSRNHKFNLHLLPDMLRKLNTCFSYGGEGMGGCGKMTFLPFPGALISRRYSVVSFVREKIRGGEVEPLEL